MRITQLAILGIVLGCDPKPSQSSHTITGETSNTASSTTGNTSAPDDTLEASTTVGTTSTSTTTDEDSLTTTNGGDGCSQGEISLGGICFEFVDLNLIDHPVLSVADYNGDGPPDIVALGGPEFNEVVILENNGFGEFSESGFHILPETSAIDSALVRGDFNGDGSHDFARVSFGNPSPTYVSVLLNNGGSTFVEKGQQELNFGGGLAAAAGDLDNDGFDDLILGTGPGVVTCLSSGDGSFSAPTPPVLEKWCFVTTIQAVRLDDDSLDDLLVTGSCNGIARSIPVAIAIGMGNGQIVESFEFPGGADPWELHISDINNDGLQDVVVGSSRENKVRIFTGDGKGSVGTWKTISLSLGGNAECDGCTSLSSSAVGDINGDGHGDIWALEKVLENGDVFNPVFAIFSIVLNKDEILPPVLVDNAIRELRTGDFNEDGYDDLVYNQDANNQDGYESRLMLLRSIPK